MSQRTTLTLENDVIARIKEVSGRTGKPMKAVVNDALRLGLKDDSAGARRPFRVRARDLGLRPELDLDDVEGLLERVEGPDRR